MQKLLKISLLLIFILTFNNFSAQLDTLNYVKQFEVNKTNYIGKSLNSLLTDMVVIQPKTVWSRSGGRVKTQSLGSAFKFTTMDLSFRNTVTLLIYWQDAIPRDDTKYYEQKNGFYFTNDEKKFYGNKIIKDIKVYR